MGRGRAAAAFPHGAAAEGWLSRSARPIAGRLFAGGLLLFAVGSVRETLAELSFRPTVLDDQYFAYERDVGDVNGDGLKDVIGVQEGQTSLQAFLPPDWHRVTLVTFSGTYRWPRADDLKAADLDRDGRPDLAFREDSQTQLWFQESGGAWTLVTLAHASHEGMVAGDLDNDGDPELILNGFWFPTPDSPAACRVAANYTNKTIDSAWFTQTGDWTANSCKVVGGDFDGDGSNDVAFSHSERAGYAVTWYRSPTPLVDGTWTGRTVVTVDYCHNLQAADWDLDGDDDLLVGGMASSQHRGLKLMLNAGAGLAWTEHVIQTDGSYSAEMGDIDNDGDPDIVGIYNWDSAPTWIYRNNAGGPPSLGFWYTIEAGASHVRTFGLDAADVDGDDRADLPQESLDLMLPNWRDLSTNAAPAPTFHIVVTTAYSRVFFRVGLAIRYVRRTARTCNGRPRSKGSAGKRSSDSEGEPAVRRYRPPLRFGRTSNGAAGLPGEPCPERTDGRPDPAARSAPPSERWRAHR